MTKLHNAIAAADWYPVIDHNRKLTWDYRFIALSNVIASWSKDPSTKTGAVIVRPDKTIASVGFNGFPKGCWDAGKLYENRDVKYARIVHAEMNAILLAKEPLAGYTMYTSWTGWGPSCDRCSAHIIQSGITRVVHRRDPSMEDRWKDSIQMGLDMYKEAGVEVTHLSV